MTGRSIIVFGLLLIAALGAFAQKAPSGSDVTKNLNQQSLEEFGVKKDSIKKTFSLPPAEKPAVNSTKDLNALEKQKIELMDVKVKPVADRDSLYWYYKKKWEDSVELAEKNKPVKPATKPVNTKPLQAEEPKLPEKVKPAVKEKPVQAESPKAPEKPKPAVKEDSLFSTKPVIKTTKPEKPVKEKPLQAEEPKLPEKMTTTPSNKVSLDSMLKKPVKEFTFETQPIVNDGKTKVNYTPDKPVKPEPKTFTSTKLSPEEEKQRQESYNAYQREADSMRFKNQKYIDSVLAALQVKLPVKVEPNDYIEIYVNGGGLISGTTPKLSDRISIFQSGVIQREYSTKQQGDTRIEKKITRDELVKLAQFIADLGFFDYKTTYACDGDAACQDRIKQSPLPRPLTIMVAIGKRRHTVNVDILAPGEKNWVNYPSGLEKILQAVSSIAEK